MTEALTIDGLVMRYPSAGILKRGPVERPAVDHVSLRVLQGEVVGIIGESGSGKTTLVRAALGILPFQEGRVTILGQDLKTLRGAAMREARSRFQLLFQDPAAMLNPGMTVREHLVESARVHGKMPAESVAEAMATKVGLHHRLDALPRSLSGGEKRRVGLARVLVPEPQLLVADEPTAGLDAALKADLIDAIVAHRSERSAVVLISHDLPMVAYACDRIVVMLDGEIVDRFPSNEMGNQDHHPYTRELLEASGLIDHAQPNECARGEE